MLAVAVEESETTVADGRDSDWSCHNLKSDIARYCWLNLDMNLARAQLLSTDSMESSSTPGCTTWTATRSWIAVPELWLEGIHC